jgi:hypothetical protein
VKDSASNMVAAPQSPLTVTETTGPTVTSATFYHETGVLVLTCSKKIDANPLQKVSLTNLHLRDPNGNDQSVSNLGGSTVAVSDYQITITLTSDLKSAVLAYTAKCEGVAYSNANSFTRASCEVNSHTYTTTGLLFECNAQAFQDLNGFFNVATTNNGITVTENAGSRRLAGQVLEPTERRMNKGEGGTKRRLYGFGEEYRDISQYKTMRYRTFIDAGAMSAASKAAMKVELADGTEKPISDFAVANDIDIAAGALKIGSMKLVFPPNLSMGRYERTKNELEALVGAHDQDFTGYEDDYRSFPMGASPDYKKFKNK